MDPFVIFYDIKITYKKIVLAFVTKVNLTFRKKLSIRSHRALFLEKLWKEREKKTVLKKDNVFFTKFLLLCYPNTRSSSSFFFPYSVLFAFSYPLASSPLTFHLLNFYFEGIKKGFKPFFAHF